MNIITYIAYLVGDSKRKILPDYEPIPLQLLSTQSNVTFVFTNPTVEIHEIDHPVGVSAIIGEDVAAGYVSGVGWVDDLHILEEGSTYI